MVKHGQMVKWSAVADELFERGWPFYWVGALSANQKYVDKET